MQDERHHVVAAITALLNGSGNRWDWRAFLSASLHDAELDRIRRCAAAVPLPLDTEGHEILLALLSQAELVGEDDPTGPKPWRMGAGMMAGLAIGALLWWTNHPSGAGLLHNFHLLVLPIAAGACIVALRNSRKKVGAYDPRIVAQNKRGRV